MKCNAIRHNLHEYDAQHQTRTQQPLSPPQSPPTAERRVRFTPCQCSHINTQATLEVVAQAIRSAKTSVLPAHPCCRDRRWYQHVCLITQYSNLFLIRSICSTEPSTELMGSGRRERIRDALAHNSRRRGWSCQRTKQLVMTVVTGKEQKQVSAKCQNAICILLLNAPVCRHSTLQWCS